MHEAGEKTPHRVSESSTQHRQRAVSSGLTKTAREATSLCEGGGVGGGGLALACPLLTALGGPCRRTDQALGSACLTSCPWNNHNNIGSAEHSWFCPSVRPPSPGAAWLGPGLGLAWALRLQLVRRIQSHGLPDELTRGRPGLAASGRTPKTSFGLRPLYRRTYISPGPIRSGDGIGGGPGLGGPPLQTRRHRHAPAPALIRQSSASRRVAAESQTPNNEHCDQKRGGQRRPEIGEDRGQASTAGPMNPARPVERTACETKWKTDSAIMLGEMAWRQPKECHNKNPRKALRPLHCTALTGS